MDFDGVGVDLEVGELSVFTAQPSGGFVAQADNDEGRFAPVGVQVECLGRSNLVSAFRQLRRQRAAAFLVVAVAQALRARVVGSEHDDRASVELGKLHDRLPFAVE